MKRMAGKAAKRRSARSFRASVRRVRCVTRATFVAAYAQRMQRATMYCFLSRVVRPSLCSRTEESYEARREEMA